MMKKLKALLFLLLAIAGTSAAAEVNIYAASSLTDALREIGAAFERESGIKVAFNFAASNVLALQIEEGAPADLFFSADEAQMDRLEKSGRIEPRTRHALLSNTLVVVAEAESSLRLQKATDLRHVARIAVGDPKLVPVGVYTRAWLEKVGLWKELESKIVPTENVRAGLAVVESGNADVAFVYATDAGISKKVKIVLRVPSDEGPPIHYPAAVVAQSPHRREAEKFLAALRSDEARQVFEKFGFVVLR